MVASEFWCPICPLFATQLRGNHHTLEGELFQIIFHRVKDRLVLWTLSWKSSTSSPPLPFLFFLSSPCKASSHGWVKWSAARDFLDRQHYCNHSVNTLPCFSASPILFCSEHPRGVFTHYFGLFVCLSVWLQDFAIVCSFFPNNVQVFGFACWTTCKHKSSAPIHPGWCFIPFSSWCLVRSSMQTMSGCAALRYCCSSFMLQWLTNSRWRPPERD